MPDKRTSGAPRERRCVTCHTPTPVGALVAGECTSCTGQLPLPLRGPGGRFLPGLTSSTSSTARGSR